MPYAVWAPYVARDRYAALRTQQSVPEQAVGAVLYADIVGFTNLSHRLVQYLGPQQGAEEVTRYLDHTYTHLITLIHQHGGEIVLFGGDSVTCWFGEPDLVQAAACGLALQAAIATIGPIALLDQTQITLALKVSLSYGPTMRLVVGDPDQQRFDLLIGAPVQRALQLDRVAPPGAVVADAALAAMIRGHYHLQSLAAHAGAVIVGALRAPLAPRVALPAAPYDVAAELIQPWVPRAIAQWIGVGNARTLATVRPAAMMFAGVHEEDYVDAVETHARIDRMVRWVQHTLEPFDCCIFQIAATLDGWCLYAGFGVPLASVHAPRHALDAALALQRGLADGSGAMSVGLSWGYVHAGCYGSYERRTYAPLGQAVNLAFRLMSQAPPGAILVSDGLRDLVPSAYAFVAAPPLRLKGFPHPVPVALLAGSRPEPNAPAMTDHLALVPGRALLLARGAAMIATARAGHPQVMQIDGEAGMGKSLLLEHMLAGARAAGFLVATSRIQPQSLDDSDAMWRPLVRMLVGIHPMLPMDQQDAALQAFLDQRAPHLRPRRALLARLAKVARPADAPAVAHDEAWDANQVVTVLVDLIRGWTLDTPLIFVIEERQWLDAPTWQVLVRVLETVHADPLPLAVVLVARPIDHAQQRGDTPWITHLRLEPLSPEDSRVFVAHLLSIAADTVPPDLLRLLHRRARGNPFIIRELLTQYQDQQLLVRETTPTGVAVQFTPTTTALQDQVPLSVADLLLSHVDRLPPLQQMLVRVAAIVGSPWDRRVVCAATSQVIPASAPAIADALDALVANRLVADAEEQGHQGVFVHPLLQEAVAAVMLVHERQHIHALIAACYHAVAIAENPHAVSAYAAEIAHHLQHANLPDQEYPYARMAGLWALEHGTPHQAIRFLSRALDLRPPPNDPAERITLLFAREQAWHDLGDRDHQQADLAALQQTVPRRNYERYAQVLLRQARFAALHGAYHEARDALQGVALCSAGIADGAVARQITIEGALQLAAILERQADYAGAQVAILQVQAVAALDDPAAHARAVFALGRIAEHEGRIMDATRHYEAALAQTTQHGPQVQVAAILCALGQIAYHQAEYSVAQDFLTRALAQARGRGDRATQAHVLTQLAWVSLDQYAYADAQSYVQQALTLAQATHDQHGEILALRCSAYSAYVCGQYARARHDTMQVFEHAQRDGYREDAAWALEHRALIELYTEDLSTSQAYAAQAVALARQIGSQRRLGFALTIAGYGWLAAGEHARALGMFDEARQIRQHLGERDGWAESQAGWALAALRQGQIAVAMAAIEPVLEALHDGPFAGADDPAQVYLACVEVLTIAADPRRSALVALAKAYLATRSAAIQDPEVRLQFEQRVPTHRQIAALPDEAYP